MKNKSISEENKCRGIIIAPTPSLSYIQTSTPLLNFSSILFIAKTALSSAQLFLLNSGLLIKPESRQGVFSAHFQVLLGSFNAKTDGG